eukprot:12006867-Heterocapsa_arctica.AAC.1
MVSRNVLECRPAALAVEFVPTVFCNRWLPSPTIDLVRSSRTHFSLPLVPRPSSCFARGSPSGKTH